MATLEEGIQQVLSRYGNLIELYRGEIPARVVAVRIWRETRGVACPTPTACCDEQGLLQLWPATRAKYGVTDACDPAQNIRGGTAHWRAEAGVLRTFLAPGAFAGSQDFWSLAYLYTAIGTGATKKLLAESKASNFSDLLAWVRDHDLTPFAAWFGTQSPMAITNRVEASASAVAAAFAGGEGSFALGLALAGVGWWLWRRFA